jgi:glycylpeptide N-tetradecanoyltransferase
MESHTFWKTQPVVETTIIPESEFGPIETPTIDQIKTDSYNLPPGFEFHTLDLDNEEELNKVQQFLNTNYLESDDENMRFAYSKECIKWITQCPFHYPELFICVRTTNNKSIIATIFGIPANVKIYDKIIPQIEINLLCVNKKFRNKRLAPVMIKEVTRRTNLRGIFQAVYTAGLDLPNKLATLQYMHRIIDVKRMSSVGFFSIVENKISIYEKLYKVKLPKLDCDYSISPIELSDVDVCVDKLNTSLSKYKLTHVFDKESFTHYFMSKPNVVYTLVIKKAGLITDMISFYIIDNIVENNSTYSGYKAGYLYYYFNSSLKLDQLINIGLNYAKETGVDVFNILKMFDLQSMITDCKFVEGNGFLNYYLYNYKCNSMKEEEIAFPMF